MTRLTKPKTLYSELVKSMDLEIADSEKSSKGTKISKLGAKIPEEFSHLNFHPQINLTRLKTIAKTERMEVEPQNHPKPSISTNSDISVHQEHLKQRINMTQNRCSLRSTSISFKRSKPEISRESSEDPTKTFKELSSSSIEPEVKITRLKMRNSSEYEKINFRKSVSRDSGLNKSQSSDELNNSLQCTEDLSVSPVSKQQHITVNVSVVPFKSKENRKFLTTISCPKVHPTIGSVIPANLGFSIMQEHSYSEINMIRLPTQSCRNLRSHSQMLNTSQSELCQIKSDDPVESNVNTSTESSNSSIEPQVKIIKSSSVHNRTKFEPSTSVDIGLNKNRSLPLLQSDLNSCDYSTDSSTLERKRRQIIVNVSVEPCSSNESIKKRKFVTKISYQ